MNIITISREFGSGGRELGKRLADLLGYSYYDREIITAIAEKHNFAESYVENVLEGNIPFSAPVTFGRTFSYAGYPAAFLTMQISQGCRRKGQLCNSRQMCKHHS